MSVVGMLPNSISQQRQGKIATFIVPVHGACNLKCSFCFIDQRLENTKSEKIEPIFYRRFIDELIEKDDILAVCIQGHEPLLKESFECTLEILKTSRRYYLPTGLVTNGVRLAECVGDLARWPPSKIAVSLDAAQSEWHDRQRRTHGAWEATVGGLRCAVEGLNSATELAVASVLIPKRRGQLEGMPTLLRELGIKQWIVTPLLTAKQDRTGGLAGDEQQIWQDLLHLSHIADQEKIDLTIDDEFELLSESIYRREVIDINSLRIRKLPRSSGFLRLLPNGQCSIGKDILMHVKTSAPRWTPGKEHAGDFVLRICSC